MQSCLDTILVRLGLKCSLGARGKPPKSEVVMARRYASTVYAVIVYPPSVRSSVTHWYCTKTAKLRITQITLYNNSSGTLLPNISA